MSVETRSREVFRFGTFEVDLRAGELRKQGVRIKLQDQPFQILSILLQNPGEVVTRDELRSQIWTADTFVDFDNSLNTSINKLREALGDSAERPRFIETLPRRGYRFIAPVGTNGTRTALSPGPTAPAHRWKIGVAVVALLAALIGGGLIWRSRSAPRLTDKDTIVLADFANTTGDPLFDDALKQGLRVQLEQSPFLNVISDQKVGEELQLMGRPKDEHLTLDLAREVCQRLGSKALLAGSISKLGAQFVVGLNALNCHTGDSLGSEQVEADSQEQVLKALGQSATRMRQRLGESLKSIEKFDAPLEQVTTSSLQAWRAYSLSMRALSEQGNAAAIPFLRQAVELDPKFAMAYARLAAIYAVNGDVSLSLENERKAYELRDKVTESERLYIEGHYYRDVTGEQEKAAAVWEVMRQTYPSRDEPYSNLAGFYAAFGNYEKALQDALEALRREPDDEDNYNLTANLYMALNRLDEAEATLKQAEERKLESDDLLTSRYVLAFLRGDEEGMARAAASIEKGKPLVAHALQGPTEAYYGRLGKARELLGRAAEAARQAGAVDSAATLLTDSGIRAGYLGDVQHARSDAEAGLKLATSRDAQYEASLAFALAGDTEHAEKIIAQMNNRFPLDTWVQRFYLPTTRAAVALAQKDPDKAIDALRETTPHELGGITLFDAIYLRGQAYLMLHNGSAAAMEFQKIIDHPGIVWAYPPGALAHLGLARAYSLQGDKAKSRAAYQHFLALWKTADPDLPLLKEARAEYAKLNAARSK